MEDTLADIEAIIEREVKHRLQVALVAKASNEGPEKMPETPQPTWYGYIRRLFGWSRWRVLPWPRKQFLVAFGEAVAERQSKQLDQLLIAAAPLVRLINEVDMDLRAKEIAVGDGMPIDHKITTLPGHITFGHLRRLANVHYAITGEKGASLD